MKIFVACFLMSIHLFTPGGIGEKTTFFLASLFRWILYWCRHNVHSYVAASTEQNFTRQACTCAGFLQWGNVAMRNLGGLKWRSVSHTQQGIGSIPTWNLQTSNFTPQAFSFFFTQLVLWFVQKKHNNKKLHVILIVCGFWCNLFLVNPTTKKTPALNWNRTIVTQPVFRNQCFVIRSYWPFPSGLQHEQNPFGWL